MSPIAVADAGRPAQVRAERRLAVGPGRDQVEPPPGVEQRAQNRPTTSRPSYSNGIGGIDMNTSSVSRATSASRSAAS